MRTFHFHWLLAILLPALTSPAGAAIQPAFSLDFSSFHATDVVVVQTMLDEDSFEVVEAWKGNLSVGDRLVIPELRPAANALPNPAHPLSWTSGAVWETIPKQSPGSRMILFLRSKAPEGPTSSGAQAGVRRGWLPSDMMNWMMASVMWMHGNQLYYLIRESNAGPSILYASKYSPEAVRNRVSEIVKNQRDMAVVLTTPNSGQRAEALKPFVRSE